MHMTICNKLEDTKLHNLCTKKYWPILTSPGLHSSKVTTATVSFT